MALIVLVLLALLADCGGGDESTTEARVYLLRDGKVWPVSREIDDADVLARAVEALRMGPTDEEEDIGLATEVPESEGMQLSRAALAHLVYTLTQNSSSDSVDLEGDRYTRRDFEEQTPSVLVESPLSFEEVSSPLQMTGTANTFEANFNYELVDADGNVVDEDFVTATSGTGTRGTFDFTTGDFEDVAALRVFELSAEDGSRIHEVEIPLRSAQ